MTKSIEIYVRKYIERIIEEELRCSIHNKDNPQDWKDCILCSIRNKILMRIENDKLD